MLACLTFATFQCHAFTMCHFRLAGVMLLTVSSRIGVFASPMAVWLTLSSKRSHVSPEACWIIGIQCQNNLCRLPSQMRPAHVEVLSGTEPFGLDRNSTLPPPEHFFEIMSFDRSLLLLCFQMLAAFFDYNSPWPRDYWPSACCVPFTVTFEGGCQKHTFKIRTSNCLSGFPHLPVFFTLTVAPH